MVSPEAESVVQSKYSSPVVFNSTQRHFSAPCLHNEPSAAVMESDPPYPKSRGWDAHAATCWTNWNMITCGMTVTSESTFPLMLVSARGLTTSRLFSWLWAFSLNTTFIPHTRNVFVFRGKLEWRWCLLATVRGVTRKTKPRCTDRSWNYVTPSASVYRYFFQKATLKAFE